MRRYLSVTIFLAGLIGCGGVANSPHSTTPPIGGATAGGGTSPANPPTIITVGATDVVGGIDVTVSTPAANPAPNAQDLGVAALTGSASAFNTGAIIHRGSSVRVVLFGPSLSGGMQVTLRGPADIQIGNLIGIKATDSTPGISFTATVSSSAALGARTVVLQNSQGDITTFTGGLEVVP